MSMQWYIIHTYSGFEKKVKESLESRVAAFNLQDKIGRVLIPMEDIVEVLGPHRQIVVAREVTKLHEEFLRGRAADVLKALASRDGVKGEITLLLGKPEETDLLTATSSRVSVRERVEHIMVTEKVDEKAALKKVAKERGISKSEAYRELQRSK